MFFSRSDYFRFDKNKQAAVFFSSFIKLIFFFICNLATQKTMKCEITRSFIKEMISNIYFPVNNVFYLMYIIYYELIKQIQNVFCCN